MPVCETEFDINAIRLLRQASDSAAAPQRGFLKPDLMVMASPTAELPAIGSFAGRRDWVFPCLWIFISCVSAFDTYLTVRFQEHLRYHEQNPIGRMLLQLAEWEPSLLISSKFLGSTLVLGILTAVYLKHRRVGFTVAAALAAFQLGLLGYLVLI